MRRIFVIGLVILMVGVGFISCLGNSNVGKQNATSEINQGGYWGSEINQGGYWGSEINQGGYWVIK
jgi:hypothetical protein